MGYFSAWKVTAATSLTKSRKTRISATGPSFLAGVRPGTRAAPPLELGRCGNCGTLDPTLTGQREGYNPPFMPLTSGTKLGPYEIQSPLGAGGMGEVYRARDTRLERDVAIKVLAAGLSSDPNHRQRLEREAKAVSKLSHPNICTLHDIGHQDGVDFLVMELVEGETLESGCRKDPCRRSRRFATPRRSRGRWPKRTSWASFTVT